MSGGNRCARTQVVRSSGPLVFRAQCTVCEEIGPQVETGDAHRDVDDLPPGTRPVPRTQLHPAPGGAPHMSGDGYTDGYHCEVVSRSPDAGGEWYLAATWADTPDEALDWLHDQAGRLAGVLDATEDDHAEKQQRYATPVARVFREWTADTEFRAMQRAALADGQPISASARGPDRICGAAAVEVLYSLAARPIFRPLLAPFGNSSADRQ
ncbi:hypothetical protein [Streptomyces spiramenti]|uniref:Uncharacterized protein n=1 Tax=Streptomyces spiramenti TaxID=2720606 RepID=A0ABX1ALK8_9ACTN|nr:hypothetical protein [Streptomyces spiramenti]NJP65357.1 hypothetical protein [Streptomyces spiramenti]